MSRTDSRPSGRRRWLVPALLLGAGAWVVVTRRSAPEADDVRVLRAPVERAAVPQAVPVAPRDHPVPVPAAVVEPAPARLAATTSGPAVSGASSEVRGMHTVASPTLVEPGPHGPGSAAPLPDGSAPGPEFTIKGNGSSRLFHPPSSPYYRRTKAEVWFRSAEDAIAAGFTPYRSRRG